MENSHKHEKSKDSEAFDILNKGNKWGRILDFRSENGQFTGS